MAKHKPKIPSLHNYFKKVIEIGLAAKPGEVGHIDVYHDDWCQVFKGGYCNCEPVVKKRPGNER